MSDHFTQRGIAVYPKANIRDKLDYFAGAGATFESLSANVMNTVTFSQR